MELKELFNEIKEINNWKNKSRIIGEACEIYTSNNIKCIKCNNELKKLKPNEKFKDFICIKCNQLYQLKAKTFSKSQVEKVKITKSLKLIGAEYSTTLKGLDNKIDYIIILYEKSNLTIKNILYVNHENINNECIIARKPLSATAKRAGWQGCYILFNKIQFIK